MSRSCGDLFVMRESSGRRALADDYLAIACEGCGYTWTRRVSSGAVVPPCPKCPRPVPTPQTAQLSLFQP